MKMIKKGKQITDELIYKQSAIDALIALDDRNIPSIKVIEKLPSAQNEVIPHRNYQYLSDYWCECGWHLGRKGSVKYCADCGRKVKWDG